MFASHLRMNPVGPALLGLALTLALPGSVQAQNREVGLEWLRNAGSVWDGEAAVNYAGRAVAAAGDVNGDGIGDFLVSAWDEGFFDPAGRIYLVYGVPFGLPQMDDLADADVILSANQMGDRGGASLAPAGDVNGDDYDDFLIGVPFIDNPSFDAGNVYLVYGGPSLPASIDLSSPPADTLTRFRGEGTGHLLGASVAGLGDVDGDDVPDLLFGATGVSPGGVNLAGRSYIVYGRDDFAEEVDMTALGSGEVVRIDGIAANDFSGARVAAAGDFNGDGFADALIGAEQANPGGKPDAGQAYIVYGGAALPDTIALASLGSAGVTINGQRGGDRLSSDISGGGDVNGDGYDDVLVGADQWDVVSGVQTDEGRAYLVYGGPSVASTIEVATLGSAGVIFTGANTDDEAGAFVAVGGDMNRDGLADLLIGAQNADPNGMANAGEAYLIHGSSALPAAVELDDIGSLGVAYFGAAPNVRAGSAVAFLGDVNGSDFDNFAISSRFANGNDGQVAVIDGSCGVLAAEGTLAEGDPGVFKVHGTPNRPFVIFYGLSVQSTPIEISKGPYWMTPSAQLTGVLMLNADGERQLPFVIPVGAGLSGGTIYWQKFEQPQIFTCVLGQVLHTTFP